MCAGLCRAFSRAPGFAVLSVCRAYGGPGEAVCRSRGTVLFHHALARPCNVLIINVFVKGRQSASDLRPFGSQKTAFWKAKGRQLENRVWRNAAKSAGSGVAGRSPHAFFQSCSRYWLLPRQCL